MTIALVLIPYTFVNNTEIADAVKVNSNFSVLASVINEVITSLDPTMGTRESLAARLDVSLNPDGTIKASALPVGTFDARANRTVDADTDIVNTDGLIIVDTTAGDVTLTLPPSATTAAARPRVLNIGLTGYAAIVAGDGADTVMGLASYSIGTAGESKEFGLGPDGNWWVTG